MRHIVVVVDGSDASREALESAVWLARQGGSTLTGLFVLDGGWPDFIGNDWQSSKGARQGFLDHIHAEQHAQAEAAREQFTAAAVELEGSEFLTVAGDPTETLLVRAQDPATDLLVVGRRVFQVSGRPSLKSLAKTLAANAKRPLLLLP